MHKYSLHLITLLTSFFFYLNTFAQQNNITGHITTSDSKPAEYVSVILNDKSSGTITNANGEFVFHKLKSGTYTIKVSAVGLSSQIKTIDLKNGESASVDFMLTENAARLNEVNISGSKNPFKANKISPSLRLQEPLLEIPQNIQIVTGQLIKDQGIQDISEGVSRNVSGVTIQEHWGNYTRMNMRGARIAPFRNGFNVESTWGPLSEDMSFVDHIEFVKGPAGFMLANGDPAGFFNVVTKKPTGTNKQEVNFTFGSYKSYRGTADLDGKLTKDGKLQYRLNLMAQTKDSWREYDFNTRYAIAPVLKYNFNDNTSLTAEYTYQYSKMNVLGSAYIFSTKGYATVPTNFTTGDPNMPPTIMNDHSAYLIFNHNFSPNWKLTAQTAYFYYTQQGNDLWSSSVETNGDMRRVLYSWDAQNKSKFGQLFVNGNVKTGIVTHKILGGLDLGDKRYIADFNQSYPIDVTTPFNIYNPVYGEVAIPSIDRSTPLSERAGGNILSQKYAGLYVQDELGFLDNRLRLTLAGRYTWAETNQYTTVIKNKKFTPRIGVGFSVDKTTSVYGLFDQSFIPQTGLIYGGTTVKPVTGNNLEAGIKKDWFDGRWNTTVSVYHILKNNQLVADPDLTHLPLNTYSVQIGQAKTNGVEFDVRGEIIKNLNLNANYAYTNSVVTKDTDPNRVGLTVPGYAKHITNAWLSYKISQGVLNGLGISGGYQWQLNRLTWEFSDGEKSDLPNYFRLDGALTYQIKKVNFAFNVNNILNTYLYSGGHITYLNASTVYVWQAEAPRNFRLGVGYKF
ncbi:MAG: TonB-dependent siderophore receptor [Janthinobacterium lividum]